jgi:hypothetical protein
MQYDNSYVVNLVLILFILTNTIYTMCKLLGSSTCSAYYARVIEAFYE